MVFIGKLKISAVYPPMIHHLKGVDQFIKKKSTNKREVMALKEMV